MAMFVSPKKFIEARDKKKQIEEQQHQEEARKVEEKRQKQLIKEEKARLVAARRVAAEATRKQRLVEKELKARQQETKIMRAVDRQLKEDIREGNKCSPKKKKQVSQTKATVLSPEVIVKPAMVESRQTRSGRKTKPPQHLQDYDLE